MRNVDVGSKHLDLGEFTIFDDFDFAIVLDLELYGAFYVVYSTIMTPAHLQGSVESVQRTDDIWITKLPTMSKPKMISLAVNPQCTSSSALRLVEDRVSRPVNVVDAVPPQ